MYLNEWLDQMLQYQGHTSWDTGRGYFIVAHSLFINVFFTYLWGNEQIGNTAIYYLMLCSNLSLSPKNKITTLVQSFCECHFFG